MTIGKPRGKNGARPVFVYHPLHGRKLYVGSRTKLRGKGGAEELQRQKTEEFAKAAEEEAGRLKRKLAAEAAIVTGGYTVRTWSEEWLEKQHGPGTKRPEPGTKATNKGDIKKFVEEFGERALDGGVGRKEGLEFAQKHPRAARTASAMYNDAVDLELCTVNQLANRRQPRKPGRKFIKAITEQETDRLAEIALDEWGREGYGLVARAWVLFGAWVGTRPGETFTAELKNMDFEAGTARIRRVKKRNGEYPVDVVVLPEIAADALGDAMPDLAQEGPMFRTAEGVPMHNSLHYYWSPIRSAFRRTVTDERWAELLDGSEDGKRLDFYTVRHRVASHIVAMGGNEYDAAHQLGNTPEVCRQVYIHQDTDQRNARNRGFLVSSKVVDLEVRRERKGA